MPTLASDIDNLNRDMEKTDEALGLLYLELGKTGSCYHKAINCAESNQVFENLCNAAEEYYDISKHIDGVRNAIKQMNQEDREISRTNTGIKDIDARILTLLSSLGAVAIEVEASGNLPHELSKCLSSAHEFESKINDLVKKRDKSRGLMLSIAERRIEKCKNGINGIFLETGKKLSSYEKSLRSMDNERINAILDEIEILNNNRKHYKSLIHSRQESISMASSSLKSQNSTLREMLVKQESAKEKMDSLYAEYGSIIACYMDKWLDDQAPEELKDVCNRIRVENKRLRNQSLNRDYLVAQKEIVINSNQIEQLKVQIAGLKEQRKVIDRQIEELESKITVLRDAIKTLEDRQSDIALNVSH